MSSYAVAILRDVNIGPEIVEYLERIDATLAPYGGHFIVVPGDPAAPSRELGEYGVHHRWRRPRPSGDRRPGLSSTEAMGGVVNAPRRYARTRSPLDSP
jgi:hypothetical protein